MPLGQPSYWRASSHSPWADAEDAAERNVHNPEVAVAVERGPSRKHSTSASWRLGSDQARAAPVTELCGQGREHLGLDQLGLFEWVEHGCFVLLLAREKATRTHPMDFSLVFEVSCTPGIVAKRCHGQYCQHRPRSEAIVLTVLHGSGEDAKSPFLPRRLGSAPPRRHRRRWTGPSRRGMVGPPLQKRRANKGEGGR